jgi:acetyl-CoA synthetase
MNTLSQISIFQTSGSTGKPKGLVHTTGGYLLCAALTVKYVFPVYSTPSRYWETVDNHKLTQFYTTPTAIHLLCRLGEQHVQGYDLSSLCVLGTVGELINPEAWNWYNEDVGRRQCAIVDTFWLVFSFSFINFTNVDI